MRISLVIPVFEEESYIALCLDHIVAQTRLPDEVLIVDNNCTDRTVDIARKYSRTLPVRIIAEPRQGVAWARSTGFDSADADILARIDADTRLEPGWMQALDGYMSRHPRVSGVVGGGYFYDSPALGSRQAALERAKQADGAGQRANMLLGNNMAIRRLAWVRARPLVKNLPGTHEDEDLSYALVDAGCELRRVASLVASISARRSLVSLRSMVAYRVAGLRTQWVHARRWQAGVQAILLPVNVAISLWVRYKAGRAGTSNSHRVSPVTE